MLHECIACENEMIVSIFVCMSEFYKNVNIWRVLGR